MKQQKMMIVGVWFAAVSALATAAPQPYQVAPPPEWVRVAPDSPFAAAARPVEAGDSDYLLVDHQVRLSKTTDHYNRYVERLVNQAAVDASASISIAIDPEHEYVSLHEVRVFREGEVLDKLAGARRSLLNREEELEQRLINGRVTLHLLLQDVRIGDVLDYSYTTARKDPISERGYNEWFNTQWATPVRHARVRIVRPADRELYELDLSALPPIRAFGAGWIDTTWEGTDIDALPNESGRPGWHYRYPRLEFSEFADWNAVREWARPMYVADGANDAGIAAQIAKLRALPDAAERILAALRFVQDDIRYTGLEIGAGAWRPTPPGEVLARRFGDCKDKVLLFVTLLRGLGIEAYPALVNSTAGKGLESRLPGPSAFDHVIAKVHWQARDYWLDATASGQGGRLDSLVQADFGRALVLDGTNHLLETLPEPDASKPTNYVSETFDLSKGTDKPARLAVRTTLRDGEADEMRVKMRTTTATQLGKDYLDYYRKRYAGIRIAQPLNFKDDRAGNVFTINEAYEIDTPFEKEAGGEWKFYLEAYLITEHSRPPEEAARVSPLARRFPLHVRQEIVAHLPDGWNIGDENVAVSDPAFEYKSTARFHGNQIELSYDLHNKRDHVPVAQLGEFLTKLDKTHDDAFYTFTDSKDAMAAADKAKGTNVRLLVALLMGLGAGAALALRMARLPWKLPQAEPGAPQGLGGWMVPPLLGMVVSPLVLGSVVFTYFKDFGRAAQFDVLADTVQWLILLELLLMGVLLTMLMFGLWQMFRFQRTFPFTFVAIQIAALVMGVVGCIALWELEAPDAMSESIKLGVRAFIDGLWVAYMLSSQRVRATFVRSRGGADVPEMSTVPAA